MRNERKLSQRRLQGYNCSELYENKEALLKYLAKLKELMEPEENNENMKTIKQVEITPVFCEGKVSDLLPSLLQENKIYISKDRDWIAFNCLCGCGDFTMLPVNQKPEGWQLEVNGDKISLLGSVQQGNCKSHYIITNNKANFT